MKLCDSKEFYAIDIDGQKCVINGFTSPKKSDLYESGLMFNVTFEDGVETTLYPTEIQRIKAPSPEETLTEQMKAAGYEPTFEEGFSDDFLMWKTIGGSGEKSFGFDGWEMVSRFLEKQQNRKEGLK